MFDLSHSLSLVDLSGLTVPFGTIKSGHLVSPTTNSVTGMTAWK